MSAHALTLSSPTGQGAGTVVHLDGVEAQGLTAVELDVRAGHANVAILHLALPAVDATGRFETRLDRETHALLLRLGWTPPAEQHTPATTTP
jgi:hypothetical protein